MVLPCQSANVLRKSSAIQEKEPMANRFPSLQDTLRMARLSKLVYSFKNHDDDDDDYCATGFSSEDGFRCLWHQHYTDLGTRVLLVSHPQERYLVVVFAGTEDVRTVLEDAHLAMKPFGNNGTVAMPDPGIKVHAGFDNAVFSHGIFDEIWSKIKAFKRTHPFYQLWTTGHSLGAANSILTATALALKGYAVTCINFGCPQSGNNAWRNYFNTTSPLKDKLGIWRVVLGCDIVARLPNFFEHVGHTIQIWSEDRQRFDKRDPNLVEAYYEHYGDAQEGYASIPSGWSSKPYFWVPGAFSHHFMTRYIEFLEQIEELDLWVDGFKKIQPIGYDDDIYDDPPDDWVSDQDLELFQIEKEIE